MVIAHGESEVLMNKVALVVICIVLCAAQTQIVTAQSVSSGMMSGSPNPHKKLRASEGIRVTQSARPRVVASPRNSADPITTGSIPKKPRN
jgi:hypothetical protein